MKRSRFLKPALCLLFLGCQKAVEPLSLREKTEAAIVGKWKLRSMTNQYHITYTNADPCFADDTFEFTKDHAILSQGKCIQFPDKPQVVQFPWIFVSEDKVDMGGDTVSIIQANDSVLIFKRDDPQYLEYHWFRK